MVLDGPWTQFSGEAPGTCVFFCLASSFPFPFFGSTSRVPNKARGVFFCSASSFHFLPKFRRILLKLIEPLVKFVWNPTKVHKNPTNVNRNPIEITHPTKISKNPIRINRNPIEIKRRVPNKINAPLDEGPHGPRPAGE